MTETGVQVRTLIQRRRRSEWVAAHFMDRHIRNLESKAKWKLEAACSHVVRGFVLRDVHSQLDAISLDWRRPTWPSNSGICRVDCATCRCRLSPRRIAKELENAVVVAIVPTSELNDRLTNMPWDHEESVNFARVRDTNWMVQVHASARIAIPAPTPIRSVKTVWQVMQVDREASACWRLSSSRNQAKPRHQATD